MHVVVGRDREVRSLDRTEHVDDATQVVEVLVKDRRADVDVVGVGRADDREVLGDPDDFADAFHRGPSTAVTPG